MTKPLNLSGGLALILCLLYSLTLSGSIITKTTSTPPPPDITCPDNIEQLTVTKDFQRTTGNLATNAPTITISEDLCPSAFSQASAGDHEYDVITFTPDTDTWYTFFLGTDFAANVTLFAGDFDPDGPCENIIGGTINGYNLPLPPTLDLPEQRLGFLLQANATYTLVISNQQAGTTGNWELEVYNDEDGSLTGFDNATPHSLAFDLTWRDLRNLKFDGPQQWLVNADGNLDTIATLATFFNNDQQEFNKFLRKLSYTGMPVVTGDCDLVLTLTDEITFGNGCGNTSITRNFQIQALDSSCSTTISSCQQTLTFRRPGLADIQWPPREVNIPCNEDFPTDGTVGGPDDNPSKQVTSSPFMLSAFGYRTLPPSIGNLSVFYLDEPRVIVCEGTYKFRREWRIGDWCAILGYATFEQIVEIGDHVGPTLGNYQDTLTVFVPPFDCNAYIEILAPDVMDGNGCSSAAVTFYEVTDSDDNFITNGSFPAPTITLPIGNYKIIRCAEDDCGNETCIETILLIQDNVAPTAQCPEDLTVTIGGGDTANGVEGIGYLDALDLYDGVLDNCGKVALEIRRNYWRDFTCDPSPDRWHPWADHLFFFCCDFDKDITVELRITDMTGNQSICSTTVTVVDELAPFCYPPTDVDIHLISLPEEYPLDIVAAYETDFVATSLLMNDLFGAASGTDNCAVDTTVEITPIIQLNECGEGTISRRFQAWQAMTDADLSDGLQIEEVYSSTNECIQTITIKPNHSFTIAFPADAQVDCDNPDVIGLEISAGDCDVLSVNTSEPVIYPGTNEACYELAITYDVINWAVWDGEADAYEIERITEDDGQLWTAGYTVEPAERPILTLVASVGPDDENCNGILEFFESNLSNQNDLRCTLVIDRSHPGEEGDSNIPDLTYDNIAETPAVCIPTQNYGRYSYTQLLSVSYDAAPQIIVSTIGGPTDECPDLIAGLHGGPVGQFGDYTGSCDAEVNIGFSVAFDCIESEELGSLFSTGLVVAELDTFAVDINTDNEIIADEFNSDWDVSESIINHGDGSYTFSGNLPIITPAMGENIYHALRIQFMDNCGNETTRIITFDVVDCKGPAPICINGLTTNLAPIPPGTDVNNDGIEDTHLSILRAADFEGSPIYDCTGQGPDFHPVTGNPRVTSYAIYLAEDVESDPLFIPSPADSLLYLTQEGEETTIVYIYAFDNEGNYDYCETYVLVQFILCLQPDCRKIEGTITTEDTETITGVGLTLYGGLYDWYQMTNNEGHYLFNQLNPYPEYTLVPSLNINHSNGITIDDINRLSDHLSGIALLTSPYQLIAADVDRSGNVDHNDLQQLQQLLDGEITSFPDNTSWRFVDKAYVFPDPANPWSETFPESMYFSGLSVDILDADFIGVKIGDVDGSAEGISPQDRAIQLEEGKRKTGLSFATDEATAELFEVYQNTPNPFQAETFIGFHLPYDSEVIFTITDLTGKQLLVRKGDYTMGYNSIQLTRDMLQGASGVLNYTVATANHVITRKMVVIW